jgi:hypothetical protein
MTHVDTVRGLARGVTVHGPDHDAFADYRRGGDPVWGGRLFRPNGVGTGGVVSMWAEQLRVKLP